MAPYFCRSDRGLSQSITIFPYCIQDILAGDELLVDYGERFWESQEVSLIHAFLMEGYEESLPRD